MAKKLNWYGVRGLQDFEAKSPPRHRFYAESIILVRAATHLEAKRKATQSFKKANIKFVGQLDCVELFDSPKEGREVYWTVR